MEGADQPSLQPGSYGHGHLKGVQVLYLLRNAQEQCWLKGTHSDDKRCFNLDLSLTGSLTSLGSAERHNLTPAPGKGVARKEENERI